MIIREIGTKTYLTPQPDHAWACGDLVRFVRPEFVEQEFEDELLAAVRHHDDGWIEWETEPQVDPSGKPLNFLEVAKKDHVEMWRKGLERVRAAQGPFAGALLTLHAESLFQDEMDADFGAHVARKRMEWAREAMPGEDPVRRDWRLERAYCVLRLCDLLTLMPMAGWQGPVPTPLIDQQGCHHELVLTMTGDWEVTIEGWPFAMNTLRVLVPTVRVETGAWPEALGELGAGRRRRQEVMLVPV
jgi:hypothetical protein